MGVWFFALGVGVELAGVIATWSAIPTTLTSVAEQTILYRHGFILYASIGIFSGLLLLIGNRVVQNWMAKKELNRLN